MKGVCTCAQVQIDHRNGTVHFGGQQLESEQMRDHLSTLASRRTQALGMIDPTPDPARQARKAEVIPCMAVLSLEMHTTGPAAHLASCICEGLNTTFGLQH